MEIKAHIEHKKLAVEGGFVHYFVSGNKQGETLVLLHPAFADHRCFVKQIDYFSPNFQIITIDMPGHGLTAVEKLKNNLSALPQIIAKMMESEGIEKIHVAGVSLGSLISQDFALKYPEKTLSVTVLGGYNIHKVEKGILKAQQAEMLKWVVKMIFSMDSFRRYVASVSVISEAEQAKFYESAQFFTRKSFRFMSGVNKIVADRPLFKRTYPLLILVGEKDLESVVKTSQQWHSNDPTSEFNSIENAGHCANMDNAERFNEILMEFLLRNKIK